MKDLIEFRFTVATAELQGKTAIAVAKILGKAISKIEPQILRVVESATKLAEKELAKE